MTEVEKSKMEISTPPIPPTRRVPPPLPPRKASTLDKLKFEAALKSAAEQSLETRSEGAPTPTSTKPLTTEAIKPSEEPLSGNKEASTPQPDSPNSSKPSPETDQPKSNLSTQASIENEKDQVKESSSPIQVDPEKSQHSSPQKSPPRSSTSSPTGLENVKESEQKRLSKQEEQQPEEKQIISEKKLDDEKEDIKSLISVPGKVVTGSSEAIDIDEALLELEKQEEADKKAEQKQGKADQKQEEADKKAEQKQEEADKKAEQKQEEADKKAEQKQEETDKQPEQTLVEEANKKAEEKQEGAEKKVEEKQVDEADKKSELETKENEKPDEKHFIVEVKIEDCQTNDANVKPSAAASGPIESPKAVVAGSVGPQPQKPKPQEPTTAATSSSYLPNIESFSQFTLAMGSAKNALESFTGKMFSDKTDLGVKASTPSASASQSSQLNVAAAETLLAPVHRQQHCLVVEGTCNYFFWMEKIAKMSAMQNDIADQNFDYLCKVLIIGNSSVGKTSFLFRYADNNFTSAFVSTVGIDFKMKTVNRKEKRIRLQIWDTAGQERYRTITTAYYRGAMGFILMYDITNEQSFSSVCDWCTQIRSYAWDDVQIVLVGNKCDKEDQRVITFERGKALANSLGIEFFETSAKDCQNVKETFDCLTDLILEKMKTASDTHFANQGRVLDSARSNNSNCNHC